MHSGVALEPLMQVLSAILILLSVGVGIAGLYSNSHTDGRRLTRSGKYMVAAMAVLGVLTFASGYAGKLIADTEEQKLADERLVRFDRQMEALRGVQADMQNSLLAQQRLYGIADRNMNLSSALQTQTRADSQAIIQRILEESNRISPDGISLAVSYFCPAGGGILATSPQLQAVQIAIEHLGTTELSLTSRVSTKVNDDTVFHDFLADLGRFESIEAWKGAQIRIRVSGTSSGVVPIERFAEWVAADADLRARGLAFYPVRCPLSVKLYLNGRQMVHARSFLVRTETTFFVAEIQGLTISSNVPRHSD